jgi:hypothetical protein
MANRKAAAAAFFVLGIAFIAIGAARQRAFVIIGLVFIVLSIVQARRP